MLVRRATMQWQLPKRSGLEPTSASASPTTWQAMALLPDGCGSASESAQAHEVAPGATDGGCLSITPTVDKPPTHRASLWMAPAGSVA